MPYNFWQKIQDVCAILLIGLLTPSWCFVSVAVHEYANSTSAHAVLLCWCCLFGGVWWYAWLCGNACCIYSVKPTWRHGTASALTSLISILLRGEGRSRRAESVLQNCVMGRCAICIFMYCYSICVFMAINLYYDYNIFRTKILQYLSKLYIQNREK